ncbi:MAG: hypothetical protein ACRD0A_01160 [Acidimicrobiales bacterium]
MIEALLWGTLAGSSFVVGGLVELRSLLLIVGRASCSVSAWGR